MNSWADSSASVKDESNNDTNTTTPTSVSSLAGKRKSTASSRGVASLTPEQLEKKRANDREAQRAIRERTKNQIETLENRIRELESQQPFQELQAVLRLKQAVQTENEEIKRRLSSILAIIQPLLGASGLTGTSTALKYLTSANIDFYRACIFGALSRSKRCSSTTIKYLN